MEKAGSHLEPEATIVNSDPNVELETNSGCLLVEGAIVAAPTVLALIDLYVRRPTGQASLVEFSIGFLASLSLAYLLPDRHGSSETTPK